MAAAKVEQVEQKSGKKVAFVATRIIKSKPSEPTEEAAPDSIEAIKRDAEALAARLRKVAPKTARALEVKANKTQAAAMAQLAALRAKKSQIEADIKILEAPLREHMDKHEIAELTAPVGRYCAEARDGCVKVQSACVAYTLRS